ncbi:hypothetical protein EXIGLDRAFT_733612 [Exidia glandulosa HHB12029]|uniref:Ubiquitin 3 binding protein But2 C-terminal domain-containing protein n=1 Tax=Exidia glandulosa HHB12029 TaxID=1314781 RepID=A0A165KFG0_EXIGL|nr:hypothetical protein EXIGLDRAFT_733612 [Exidia glandulosa HHB12029]
MFAKTQLIAVLLALPFAFSLPQGSGVNCNLDPLTVSNWAAPIVPSDRLHTKRNVTFDVASPDVGTSPTTHCVGSITESLPGFDGSSGSGTCSDGGEWSVIIPGPGGPATLLVVTLPRECPAGVSGTLQASTELPPSVSCTIADSHGIAAACAPFELENVH